MAAGKRSELERRVVSRYYLQHAAPATLRQAWQQRVALGQQMEQLERSFPTTMVMADTAVPKQTHLLLRGAYDRPGEEVRPALPRGPASPAPRALPNNRLGFARWLTSPDNPLFARVTVNRIWQMYFGVGLVKTSEDFGSQGEWPSNPDLLDWLATEFQRSGWDLKALHRLIVTSATYRQSSRQHRKSYSYATDPAMRTGCWLAGHACGSRRRWCGTRGWPPLACSQRRSADLQ